MYAKDYHKGRVGASLSEMKLFYLQTVTFTCNNSFMNFIHCYESRVYLGRKYEIE